MSRSSFSQFPARFPRGGRAFSSRESRFASRRENDPDSDVESEFRGKPEFALADGAARGFRRLFAEAQSTAASKLANPLINQRFLVLRRPPATPPRQVTICPARTPTL